MKKLLAMILSVAMVLSVLVVPASAESATAGTTGIQTDVSTGAVDFSKFKDVKGHWAESDLRWAVDNGLMAGVTSTAMQPDRGITRAQMAMMIVRAFGATQSADISMFVDVKRDDWCYSAIARAVQMGCLSTFGNSVQPNETVTREEVASTLVKAAGYTLVESSYLSSYSDRNRVSDLNQQYIATAIANGLMAGYKDGTLKPQVKVTRAQFAVMMKRLANAHMTQVATYSSKTVEGSLLVGVGGLTLNGMSVSKNLFLSDGCGTGEIVLDGTTVNGTMYVRGTGPNTVTVKGGSRVQNVVLCNPNNAVTLAVEEGSYVGGVNVQKVVSNATIKGNVGNVIVTTGTGPVKLTNADVSSLTLASKFAAVQVDSTSVVKEVSLLNGASGAELDLAGRSDRVYVNAEDSIVNISGTVRTLEFGSRAETCKLTISSTATVTNVDLGVNSLKLSLTGTMSNADIGGNNSEITFASGANITRVDVDGSRTDVEFASGSKAEKVYTTGDDLALTGKGNVTDIQVNDGKNISISIPGARVYNKGGTNVKIGNYTVRRGDTVIVNAAGDGIVVDNNGNAVTDPNATGNNNGTGTGTDTNPNQQTNTTYVITLAPNGGTLAVVQTTTDSYGIIPTLPTPIRTGYTFLGWYTSESGGIQRSAGQKLTSHTTLYAHWQENGGGSTGGGDEPGPGPNPGPGEVTTVTLSLPSGAQPSDFGYNSIYTYSGFGAGLTLNPIDNALTGTVEKIDDFKWFTETGNSELATGYYVPVLIVPALTTIEGTLTIGEMSYGSEMYSMGSQYGGQIIGYLYLDPFATTKTIDVVYDPDGAGTTYAPVTITVNYGAILFHGDGIEESLYAGIVVAPGVDGAETPVLVNESSDTTQLQFSYSMSTTSLLETRKDGRYGNWIGLIIPAPSDIIRANIIESRTDASDSSYQLSVRENSSGAEGLPERYIEWWANAATKPADGKYTIELSWIANDGNASGYQRATIIVDASGVILAGQNIPVESQPVVSDVAVTLMTDEECLEQFGWGLTKFGTDLRTNSSNAIRGTFIPVSGTTPVGDYAVKTGYYVPLRISAKAAGNVNVKVVREDVDAGIYCNDDTEASEDGSFTAYALLEIVPMVNGASDIKVIFKALTSGNFYDVSKVLDTSNANLVSAGLIALETLPTGTIEGKAVSSLWTGGASATPELNIWRSFVDIGREGTNKANTVKQSNVTLYGMTYTEVWLVPFGFRVVGDMTGSTVYMRAGDTTLATWTATDFDQDGFKNILIPVAADGAMIGDVDIILGNDEDIGASQSLRVSYRANAVGFVEKPYTPNLKPTIRITEVEDTGDWVSDSGIYSVSVNVTQEATEALPEEGTITLVGHIKSGEYKSGQQGWCFPILLNVTRETMTKYSAELAGTLGYVRANMTVTNAGPGVWNMCLGKSTDITSTTATENWLNEPLVIKVYDVTSSTRVQVAQYTVDVSGVVLEGYPGESEEEPPVTPPDTGDNGDSSGAEVGGD